MKKTLIYIILIFLIGFGTRLLFLGTDPFTPDATLYYDVAKNTIEGDLLISKIKRHFFNERQVIHYFIGEKPILTPILFSAILSIKDSINFLQGALMLLGSLSPVLLFFLVRKFTSNGQLAFLASLLLALNPNIVINNKYFLNDQIFLILFLSIFTVFYSRLKVRSYVLGILIGLSYLTRPSGLFVLLAVIFGLWFDRKERKAVVGVLVGFLFITLPFFYYNTKINGSPFYSDHAYNLKTLNFSEDSFTPGVVSDTVVSFVTHNYVWIARRGVENFLGYTKELFGMYYLSLLSLLSVLGLVKYFKRFLPIVIVSILTMVLLMIKWGGFEIEQRFLFSTFAVGLILACTFISNFKSRSLGINPFYLKWVGFCVYLFLILSYSYPIVHEKLRLSRGEIKNISEDIDFIAMSNWVEINTNKEDIFGTYVLPNRINSYMRRPVSILPRDLDENSLFPLLDQYHIKYIVSSKTSEYSYYQGLVNVYSNNKYDIFLYNK